MKLNLLPQASWRALQGARGMRAGISDCLKGLGGGAGAWGGGPLVACVGRRSGHRPLTGARVPWPWVVYGAEHSVLAASCGVSCPFAAWRLTTPGSASGAAASRRPQQGAGGLCGCEGRDSWAGLRIPWNLRVLPGWPLGVGRGMTRAWLGVLLLSK